MNLSKEKIHQDRNRPEKDIVDPIAHGVLLLRPRRRMRDMLVNLVARHRGGRCACVRACVRMYIRAIAQSAPLEAGCVEF